MDGFFFFFIITCGRIIHPVGRNQPGAGSMQFQNHAISLLQRVSRVSHRIVFTRTRRAIAIRGDVYLSVADALASLNERPGHKKQDQRVCLSIYNLGRVAPNERMFRSGCLQDV